MEEPAGVVDIKFLPAEISGTVAVGTYVADAARRLGVKLGGTCFPAEGIHFCAFTASDETVLSEVTDDEKAYFSRLRSDERFGQRLGCRTRIEASGEIEITMSINEEKHASSASSGSGKEIDPANISDAYLKNFAALPLDKKIGELTKLEAVALSDTLVYILNAPLTIADRILNSLAGYGRKLEQAEAEAARPVEHRAVPSEEKNK